MLEIHTKEELLGFFEAGPLWARLSGNINMAGSSLTVSAKRGSITLEGGGYTVTGEAPALIRMEDSTSLWLENITLNVEKIAVGFFGDGSVGGKNCKINSTLNALHAAGEISVLPNSSMEITAAEGTGIAAMGITVGESAALVVEGMICAVNANDGGLVLEHSAQLTCEAAGDNVVRTDDTLQMEENTLLKATNTGTYIAVRANSLALSETARMEASGGENGAGLFVVDQHEDIVIRGFSTPDVSQEGGAGSITFRAEE